MSGNCHVQIRAILLAPGGLWNNSQESGTILDSAAHIEAANDLHMRAGGNLVNMGSVLQAGVDAQLRAGQDLIVAASSIDAAQEAWLVAGGQLALLSAEDLDYSFYEKKKKGSFGRKSFRSDQVTRITQQGTEITTGGDLALISGADQTCQAANLQSGEDLTLTSGGGIDFEGVKDLHQESHEKSSSNWAWQSAKGKGNTDETLIQTQMRAQGELIIQKSAEIGVR
ncbi:hemagglutinin repeat-containing protein [Halopseudomonas yangmingensis]|uniref:Filamentous hemagglutinin n=1 Tax=Halopseudomonas yangmingensis TaxID=1720063 RepID=A0A1I4REF7_9GAMM|nr:hemagglutinin repeat-containing protein [Halopseudomonas yangmingensis]SFM50330.1 filamentous hemagglutinin [Halopseudomonas yangmingensis]